MSEIVLFDYGQLDVETRIVVQQRTSEIKDLLRSALGDMIEAGRKCKEVRDALRHDKSGGFMGWVDKEGLGRQTVYSIMSMHDVFGNYPKFGQLDIGKTAAYLLAAPSTPEPARLEAIERAEAGETITHTVAKQIVAQHRTPTPSTPTPRHTLEASAPAFTPPSEPPPSPPLTAEHKWTPSEIERRELADQGRTVHANMKTDLALIEWAKSEGIFARVDRATEWGNPFHLPDDGDRATVLESYRWYLQRKPSLMARLYTLKGRVLGCWCYPEPCHAGILEEYANEDN